MALANVPRGAFLTPNAPPPGLFVFFPNAALGKPGCVGPSLLLRPLVEAVAARGVPRVPNAPVTGVNCGLHN